MELKSFLQKCKRIQRIGKDRLVILVIAGLLLLLIQTPSSKLSSLVGQKETNESTEQEESQNISEKYEEENRISDTDSEKKSTSYVSSDEYVAEMENKLKQVLCKINGVGITEVIVTVETSGELVVEKDKPYTRDNLNETDAEGGSRSSSTMSNEESTVFWRDTQGNEIPFISKEIDPKITGVLIVCQGGDNEAVRKEITESLQALFDLDAHKIKVAKMVTAR